MSSIYDISDIEQKRRKKHVEYKKPWEGGDDDLCFSKHLCGDMESAQKHFFPLKNYINSLLYAKIFIVKKLKTRGT